jgi:carbamoyltransferase
MKVLGVSIGHDSNACLVEDGKIVRYIAEERFNRIKTGVNGVLDSVKFCLNGDKMEDVDKIAISDGLTNIVRVHFEVAFKAKSSFGMPVPYQQKGYDVKAVIEIPHHDCHAASAYYTSGLKESLIITIDGIGSDVTQCVYIGSGGKIKPMAYVKTDGVYIRGKDGVFRVRKYKKESIYSWGWFYGSVTEALFAKPCQDEGKTMGLAPFGDASKVPEREMKEHMYKVQPMGFYHNNGQVYYHFGAADEYTKMIAKYGRENVAASAQKILENKILTYIKRWMKRTGQKNLCTAGGVFLNVKLNQRIMEECGLDNYWPFPLASDSGLSIGAALLEYHKTNPYVPQRLSHLYYGSEYSDQEIEAILKRNKISYQPYSLHRVAEALAENKIVGWFQGKMEGGPRALGNRSILMSPLKAENKDIINKYVKFREGFRPFCPSVTEEAYDKYFYAGANEFMIIACKVRNGSIPAVTHVDKTARPQIVRHKDNPKFHELLTAFGEKTGHPVLLNTSLNVMGEPIIRSPEEAIRCFYGVGIDILVLGNYMIEKGRA